MKKTPFVLLFFLTVSATFAQLTQPPFTPATERVASAEQRQALIDGSLVAQLPFRNVGPSVFSGRVSDIAVHPEDPSIFYVAYASGGLWKTTSNGTRFTPIFDQEMVMTIGDIAVDWENNTVWVGTGEVNSSRSSYAGTGVFKSNDDGKTWQYLGLGESHHIGRILIDPNDPNTVFVAALGHLYSPNKERGIYKTTDGGANWKKVLFVNDNAGAVDLLFDPLNPNTIYAATWERTRRAWNFEEAGEGSGIYISQDKGENWTLLTSKSNGFPTGKNIGRIGLDAAVKDGKTVLYAILDNYNRRPKEEEASKGLTKDQLRSMSKAEFLELKDELIAEYLEENDFPEKYNLKAIRQMIASDQILPIALVEYVEDANSLLFDTPVIGAEVYRSVDGGTTWAKTHDDYLDRVYNSYGYYFGQIRVDHQDPDKIYIMGVPVLRSDDAGKSWTSINGDNVHVDHHALWVNPNRTGHLILGNDGGINISYDDGESWFKCNSPAVGQFYAIAVDHDEPYNIYGGLQDNGVWVGPSTYQASDAWHGSGRYPYQDIIGGDGMQVAVDTRDNRTIYTGFQFGNYFKVNWSTGQRTYITPKHELGERPLRWNWQSPVHLSLHNQDILYFGSNKLHRSMQQGTDFETLSDDLTKGGKKGDVAYGTLTTIHESPLRFGLLYTGSDDGLVHVSKDGGHTWQNISSGLPEDRWITRLQASAFEEGRVYVSLNGYRWDNFTPLIYVSEDYGKNWKRIGQDLPLEPVNVIKEDPVNPDLLYVGTDHGLYCSLDRGQTFMAFQGGLPAVAVHDLVVHPKAHDLVVGTHGRSIYVGKVQELQQLDAETLAKPVVVFDLEKIRYQSNWGNSWAPWVEAKDPSYTFPVYASQAGDGEITVKYDEIIIKSWTATLEKGLNYVEYQLDIAPDALESYLASLNKETEKDPIELKAADTGKYYLYKGEYEVAVKAGEALDTKTIKIE